MGRINLKDSLKESTIKLIEGNPGALQCLIQLLKETDKVADNFSFGYAGVLLTLDTWEIYGTAIYVLWNDICDRDCGKFLACLRAAQLGIITPNVLKDACHRQDRSGLNLVNSSALLEKVRQKIPSFWR